jgi:hypothetical protein
LAGNSVTILGSGNAINSQVINLGDLNDAAKLNQLQTGEQWEGAFVELQNVTVTAVTYFSSNTRVSFDVVDASGNKINVSDRFMAGRMSTLGGTFVPPNVGDTYTSIKGLILHSKNNCPGLNGRGYELHPFLTSHYVLGATSPLISNVSRNLVNPTSSQSETITATITDADGSVSGATLFYAIGASSNSYTSVPMTASGSTYTATIPAQANGTFVKYYITAIDNNNNTTFNPNPTPSTGTYFYTVRDNGTTIYDLQYTPYTTGNSGYTDMTVTVTGEVTASAASGDLGYVYIQQPGQLAWAGIMLTGNATLSTLTRGQTVTVTGVVKEDFGFTRMESISAITTGSTTNAITPLILDPNVFTSYGFATNEQYEGMLIGVKNPTAGQPLRVVDVNADAVGAATTPNFGEYRVGSDQFDPNSGVRVLAGRQASTSFSSLNVSFVNSLTWATVDGTMNVPAILVSDTMTIDTLIGIMYYSFSNMKLLPRNNDDFIGGNLSVGVREIKRSDISVYPNPVQYELFVDGASAGSVVEVRDIAGRACKTESVSGRTSISMNGLSSGLYMVNVKDHDGNVVLVKKVIVNQ